MRGVNRKGVDHPIQSANLDSKKATAVHVPIVEVENAVNEPVNKDPPVSVTQLVPTDVQSQPLEDIAKAVEDTADMPVNVDPPVSVTQHVQSQPLEDIAKAVEDTADMPVKKDSSPRIELKFPEGTCTLLHPFHLNAFSNEAMIAKMANASGSGLDTAYFIKQIDDITVNAIEFSANAQALLAAVPNVSSKVNETKDQVMATIDGIASAHPILKISWFIVSAGYKMVSDASKVNQEYLELPEQFQAILEDVSHFLDRPIKGIADNITRNNLVKASERIILCLTDAAILFTEYMDTPGTTWSNIDGSNKSKLDEMKARLADVQEAHQSAKDKGLFTIMVTVASDVVDTKEVVHEVARRVENIDATLQAHAKESEEKKLQQLCQKRDPHRAEVNTLVNRCAKGTRKWIVDQALESIQNGEEKITWLRCEAGTGKSVIAGRVAQELKQKGLLGATFFCKFNDNKSNNMVGLIQTIAFELANVNDQFRTALIKTLTDWGFQDVNENKIAMPNTEKLLQLFLEEPMEAWPKTLSLVVVIDALDEIKNISEDIHLLLGTFLCLESVKLFITSRPEIKDESIEISTGTKKSSVALIAFKQNDERNLEDIRMFATSQVDTLFAKFPAFGPNERKRLVELFVQNSTGLFIWITLVLGNVDGHDSQVNKGAGGKKKQRASVVAAHVRKNKNKLPETSNELASRLEAYASMGLQKLYCRAFSEAFLDVDKMEKEFWLKLFKASVGTLMVLKVPMSRDQLPYLVVSEDDDMFDEILASLDQISALLHVDDNDKLSFIHKTVQDYLIDIGNNLGTIHDDCPNDTNFKLDLGEISFKVAMSCLKLLNTVLHKNMAEPKLDGCLNYSDGHGNEWTIDKESLTESVQYAILYWSDHFVDAVKMVDANQQEQLLVELERFCKTQLLYYLEAILLLKKLDLVPRVVNSVLSCLGDIRYAGTPSAELRSSDLPSADIPFTGIPSSINHSAADVQFISSILQDLKLVSINFRPQLMVSPLQVYNHALISVPQQTEYYRNYHQMASARITIGAEQNWGPMTLSGHSSDVYSVAISPDGKSIVSGSCDETVKVWDMQTGECTLTLKGHLAAVLSVCISPDGNTIVSGSYDGTVKVWDMRSGQCMLTFKGHSSDVHSVAISPDNKTIVSGSWDDEVKVWDIQTGECTLNLKAGFLDMTDEESDEEWWTPPDTIHFDCFKSVAISPDSKKIVSGFKYGTIKVWDMQTGKCLQMLQCCRGSVTSVAISPDSNTIVCASSDKTVQAWSLQTGECTLVWEGHSSDACSVAISPDSKTIVSGFEDGTVKVWNMQTEECILTLEGHSKTVKSVAISPDSNTIVSGSWDKTVKVWDMQTGECALTFKGHSSDVNSVALSLDSKTTVSGFRNGTLKVWNMQTGECALTWEGHSSDVCSVAISPDSKTIVSGSHDKTVKVWKMQTGECTLTLDSHLQSVCSVAISPDGKSIVSGSRDETVKVWDMLTGKCKLTLQHSFESVLAVGISPDSKTIVSGTSEGIVHVWDMQTGELKGSLGSPTMTSEGFMDYVVLVAISCKTIVYCTYQSVQMWDMHTGEYTRTRYLRGTFLDPVSVSPDGKSIVSPASSNGPKVLYIQREGEWVDLDSSSGVAGSVAMSPEELTHDKEGVSWSKNRMMAVVMNE
ncbi:hypothetical protein HDU77_010117 [Chytriomyces hyalinus]|nr:hypothetical protein HDU77_010117 [Chytriomyces hyalinus]